jgi:aarF domain-containing kinase
MCLLPSSALPILRQLGAHGNTGNMIRSGDFSMLKVWVGLELRGLFQASIESVSISHVPTTSWSLN